MYYFDYASTTQIDERILEIYNKISKNFFLHPQANKQILSLQEESKSKILRSLHLDSDMYQVIYTSSGTEANNLAVIGYASRYDSPKHFITTEIEHPSVYESFKFLETQGHRVTYLKVDENGFIDLKQLRDSIYKDTVMISIMSVNNEIGTIQAIDKIFKIIKEINSDIVFMSDVVQAIGKTNINYNFIDMMSISAHKLHGPKSAGCLIKKKDIDLLPITYGGHSASVYRSGTECLASQISFSYALANSMINLKDKVKDIEEKTLYLVGKFSENKNIQINNYSINGIVNINVATNALSETLLTLLNEKDIIVSTKSACSFKMNTRSRVLKALNIDDEKIDRSLRISLSNNTTKDEIDYLINTLSDIVNKY